MHSDGFVTAEISISRLQNHFPCDSKIGWSRAAHRLTAVSRVREKLVEKRLLGGKRRMGFPFKGGFFVSVDQIPRLVIETQRQPSMPPPVGSFLGGVCQSNGKSRSVTWFGLVQV